MLGACDGDLEGDLVGSVDKSSTVGASVGLFVDGEDVGNLEGESVIVSGDGLKDDGWLLGIDEGNNDRLGRLDGCDDGQWLCEGLTLGFELGIVDMLGWLDDWLEGSAEGRCDISSIVGLLVGSSELGRLDGWLEGSEEGVEDGSCNKVGLDVGLCVVGTSPVPGDGCIEGWLDGCEEELADGSLDGDRDGCTDKVGTWLGLVLDADDGWLEGSIDIDGWEDGSYSCDGWEEGWELGSPDNEGSDEGAPDTVGLGEPVGCNDSVGWVDGTWVIVGEDVGSVGV